MSFSGRIWVIWVYRSIYHNISHYFGIQASYVAGRGCFVTLACSDEGLRRASHHHQLLPFRSSGRGWELYAARCADDAPMMRR